MLRDFCNWSEAPEPSSIPYSQLIAPDTVVVVDATQCRCFRQRLVFTMPLWAEASSLSTKPGPRVVDGLHPVPEITLHPVAEPTLEVAQSHYDAPEVFYMTEKEGVPTPKDVMRRRLLILIAVLLIILIITATVVGGVVGSRASNGSQAPASDESPTQDAMTSTTPVMTASSPARSTPTSIAPNSPLAVAPVYDQRTAQYYFYLTFKSRNGDLHYSVYDTTLNPPGSHIPAYWGFPRPLSPENSPSDSTMLAMTSQESILTMFYVDSSSNINDLVYDTTRDAPSEILLQTDVVKRPKLVVIENSSIGTYGPWRLAQDVDCTLLLYVGIRNCEGNATQGAQKRLQQTTLRGTQLAIVPLTSSGIDVSLGAIAILYQDEGGKLVATPLHKDLWNKPDGYRDPQIPKESWTLNGFPDVQIPEKHSLAAFARKRDSSESQVVSIFILYQDKAGNIQQIYLDDGLKWKTASPKALAGADPGTSITCISQSSRTCRTSDWEQIGPSSSEPLASDLHRCYFWRNGLVVEVKLKGSDWVELGHVNLP
ncbi:hypothetical protein HJFPF1_09747 [Paramyrothecium foliicola]|nr:hypothetical protein HJFPF1_09747 [Paramyrothecium foliicola]